MENEENLRIEQLKAQIERLEKLSSLGMLSAGIAHEIQNPLNFVINFSKLSDKLLEDLSDILEEEKEVLSPETLDKLSSFQDEMEGILSDLHDNLHKIEAHGNRAMAIIRGILLYSRGKDDEFVECDPVEIVREYIRLAYHSMRASYKGFNISIHEEIGDNIPKVRMIPQDYSRAVLNLMNNACYAVYSKSKIAAVGYRPEITVKMWVDANDLCLSIEDNGVGLSETVRQNMFTAFFTTKPLGEGTGLGLSITRSIIEDKHKGRIEVASEEGLFTRFTIRIPIVCRK